MTYTREQLDSMPDHQLARLANIAAGCEYEVCDIHTGARRPANDDDMERRCGVGVAKGVPLFIFDTLSGDGMLRVMELATTKGMHVMIQALDSSRWAAEVGYTESVGTDLPRALAIAFVLAGQGQQKGGS